MTSDSQHLTVMRYCTYSTAHTNYHMHTTQPRTFASVLEEACTVIADEQLDSLPGQGRTFNDVSSDVILADVPDVDCVSSSSSSSNSSSSTQQQADEKLLILQ